MSSQELNNYLNAEAFALVGNIEGVANWVNRSLNEEEGYQINEQYKRWLSVASIINGNNDIANMLSSAGLFEISFDEYEVEQAIEFSYDHLFPMMSQFKLDGVEFLINYLIEKDIKVPCWYWRILWGRWMRFFSGLVDAEDEDEALEAARAAKLFTEADIHEVPSGNELDMHLSLPLLSAVATGNMNLITGMIDEGFSASRYYLNFVLQRTRGIRYRIIDIHGVLPYMN